MFLNTKILRYELSNFNIPEILVVPEEIAYNYINNSTFKELSNYQIECNGSASAPLSDDHKHQIREQKWGDTLISLNLRQNRFRFFGLRRAFCCQRLFKKIFYPAMASAGAAPSKKLGPT